MKPVREIMDRELPLVQKNAPVKRVIDLFKRGLSSVIVVNSENEPLGIITKTDIIKKSSKTISSLMTQQLKTIHPEDDILLAHKIMFQNQLRHLPVLKGKKIIGLVRIEDIAAEMQRVEKKNRHFLMYQNAQTIIIVAFIIFLIVYLLLKTLGF